MPLPLPLRVRRHLPGPSGDNWRQALRCSHGKEHGFAFSSTHSWLSLSVVTRWRGCVLQCITAPPAPTTLACAVAKELEQEGRSADFIVLIICICRCKAGWVIFIFWKIIALKIRDQGRPRGFSFPGVFKHTESSQMSVDLF